MAADFKGIVLAVNAESIQTNGLKDVIPLHSFEPTVNIRAGKRVHITHVQTLCRRVRKHHEIIKRTFRKRTKGIKLRLPPLLTPSGLNFLMIVWLHIM